MTVVFGRKVERGAVPGVETEGAAPPYSPTGEDSGAELSDLSSPARAIWHRGDEKASETVSAAAVADGGPEWTKRQVAIATAVTTAPQSASGKRALPVLRDVEVVALGRARSTWVMNTSAELARTLATTPKSPAS
jgi:hypothetical protein